MCLSWMGVGAYPYARSSAPAASSAIAKYSAHDDLFSRSVSEYLSRRPLRCGSGSARMIAGAVLPIRDIPSGTTAEIDHDHPGEHRLRQNADRDRGRWEPQTKPGRPVSEEQVAPRHNCSTRQCG